METNKPRKKDTTVNIYSDGATIRSHNKRVSFNQNDQRTIISFQFADTKDPASKPACGHSVKRGIVRDTFIFMSNEARESLVYAYINFKRQQAQQKSTSEIISK